MEEHSEKEKIFKTRGQS